MDQEEVLRRVEEEVKREMMGREGSHDFHHVERVVALALKLAEEEGADPFIVHLSALVHDLYDWKEHPDDYLEKLAEFLEGAGVSGALQERVLRIVEEVSYRGGSRRPASAEGRVVQDADRLDALGAIGVARAFSYGGSMGRPLYNPEVISIPGEEDPHHPRRFTEMSLEDRLKGVEEMKGDPSTIFHFYEKLLLLKDYMNTKTGRKIAERRTEFMVRFLEEFFGEWVEDCGAEDY